MMPEKRDPAALLTPVKRIQSARPPQDIEQIAINAIQAHQGTVMVEDEQYTVDFPPETVRREQFPRVLFARFDILFPDGFIIHEVQNHQGKSELTFPLSLFPEEIQHKYRWHEDP